VLFSQEILYSMGGGKGLNRCLLASSLLN